MNKRTQLLTLLREVPALYAERYAASDPSETVPAEDFLDCLYQIMQRAQHLGAAQDQISDADAGTALQRCQAVFAGLSAQSLQELLQQSNNVVLELDRISPQLSPNNNGNNLTKPLNQKIINQALRPQQSIIVDKKIDFMFDDSFDEPAFAKKEKKLGLFRNLLWRQLKKNIIQAVPADLEKCLQHNAALKASTAHSIFKVVDQTQQTFQELVAPKLAPTI